MSVSNRAVGALLATIVAGAATLAVIQTGGAANASGPQSTSTSVGRAQPGSEPSLVAVLALTRSTDGQTYRAAGTYSAGSALTSVAGG
jgi:hypothetical protein